MHNFPRQSTRGFNPIYPNQEFQQHFASMANPQFFNNLALNNPYANMQNYFMFITGFYNFHMEKLRAILNKQNETISEQVKRISTYDGDLNKYNHYLHTLEDKMSCIYNIMTTLIWNSLTFLAQETIYNIHFKEMQSRYEKAVQNVTHLPFCQHLICFLYSCINFLKLLTI